MSYATCKGNVKQAVCRIPRIEKEVIAITVTEVQIMTCKTIKLKDDPNTLIFNDNSSSPIHQCTITWGSMLKIILSIIALSCVINGASSESTVYTDIRPVDLGSLVSGSPEASISSLPIIISLKGTSDSNKYAVSTATR